jgi:NAD(P)-dependent dehydrogenase (short-subunit alcohol dehydrogenase family)
MSATRLDGRRIVITGGASGMGEGLVRALPALGAEVVSLDLAEERGTSIAAEVGVGFHQIDVSDPDSVQEAFAAAVGDLGGLDVLINAAGIAPGATAVDTTLALWDKVMAVNATGTLLTNQAAFPYLREAGGQILNFASAAGVNGYPAKPAYAASKGAVLAWSRSVAVEWAPFAITVNCIVPGIWTPMYDTTRSLMSPETLAAHDEVMKQRVPLKGRLGDIEEDFVPVMAFLASEGARFMTGQMFAIDGGSTMVR